MNFENSDLEKIIALVLRKEEFGKSQTLVSHGEDHSYQGVLVNTLATRFHITPIASKSRGYETGGRSEFLDYILRFDVSHWTDVADPELLKKYKEVRRKFRDACNEIHPDDKIEITYSVDLRIIQIPLVF